MRRLPFLAIYFLFIFNSCNKKPLINLHAIFNENNLEQQFFDINISKDTTLLTSSGCVIKITAGSLQSSNAIVKLEIREAINLKDILLAGLTTKAGNQLLSSAGMIYINTVGNAKATIIKPLEVLVPTEMYNANMQVYKGEMQDGGNIDWQKPTKLPDDETSKKISVGEQIYKANCSNCYKLEADYTGPYLLGITYKRSKRWLYDFMKSPGNMIGDGDCNSIELFNNWKPTVMTAFPNLENGGGLDSVFAYIKAETDKKGLFFSPKEKTLYDSCYDYKQILKGLNADREKLVAGFDEFYSINRTVIIGSENSDKANITTTRKYVTSEFYTIKVENFGWYNLDCLLKNFDACKDSEINVHIENADKDEYTVSLVIPALKVFIDGSKMKNSNTYTFGEINSSLIKLPQSAECFVLAYTQKDEKLLFARKRFVSSLKQTLI